MLAARASRSRLRHVRVSWRGWVSVVLGVAAVALVLAARAASTGRMPDAVPAIGAAPAAAAVPTRAGVQAASSAWCGTAASEDRPPVVTGKTVHVIYAYPSDRADRFSEVASRIQGDAELLDTWWRGQDSARSLRFDLTTYPCGNQLDITTVKLSGDASSYLALDTRYERATTALRDLGFGSQSAMYLVFLDGPVEGNVCGQGGGRPDVGGSFALVYLLGPCSELETVAVHELVHTFGYVGFATGATHTCPEDPWHVCDSDADLMSQRANDLFTRTLDVNRDDYYGHPGTWSDLQDSPWLTRPTSAPVALTIRGSGRVTSVDPGIDCTATCETVWDVGIPVGLDAEPADGMRLVRWEDACTGGDQSCVLPHAGAETVTALFAAESFRLSIAVSGKGTVRSAELAAPCVRRCSVDATSFVPVRLSARPAKGWRFVRWGGGCRGTRPVCQVPMATPTAVRATFAKR